MKNAIGIIGGMGPMASQLFYKMVTEHTVAEKDQDHINLVILSDASMPDRTGAILAGEYDGPYNQMLEDAQILEKLGCKGIAITWNSDSAYDQGNCSCGCGRMSWRKNRHYGYGWYRTDRSVSEGTAGAGPGTIHTLCRNPEGSDASDL